MPRLCAKIIVIDLALAGNTVLIYRVSLLSAVGGKCTSFCGVAKSDGCWNRGDPLCVSWDIESFVSLHSGNNRIRTGCCCGALSSSSVDGFLGCQLEISEIAPALKRGYVFLVPSVEL